jgi:hypothetical protein
MNGRARALFVPLSTCFLLLVLPPLVAAQAQTVPQPTITPPQIAFKETVFDFGKVEQGDQVNHLFRFTNQGGRDLRIESVKTSCGCTAAVISSEVTTPGSEGTISATFDTSKFFGEKVKQVTVHSNDPVNPVVTLTLQGEIAVEVEVNPAQLYLGKVRRGASATHVIELLHDASKPISITNVAADSPLVSVQTEELEKSGKKGKKLIVTLKKDAPLGRVSTEINVTTTSQKRPSLSIPVFGQVEGDLVVTPSQVSFGVVRRGENKENSLNIKSRAAKPIHLVKTQSSTPTVIANLVTVKNGEEYSLTLKVNPESAPGQIKGEVQVFTDHPTEKVLTIPVYGMLVDPQAAKK